MSAVVEVGTPERVIEVVEIASIVRDVVVRAKGTNGVTVAEYAAAMLAHGVEKFEPITCYRDSRNVVRLSDGAHRVEAAETIGATTITAEVRAGGRKDCIQNAVISGREFGLRFSTRDKRFQIELMLGNFPKWSDRKIAEALAVDHKTVAATKRRLAGPAGEIPQSAIETGSEPAPKPVADLDQLVAKFRKLLSGVSEEHRALFGEQILDILSNTRENA